MPACLNVSCLVVASEVKSKFVKVVPSIVALPASVTLPSASKIIAPAAVGVMTVPSTVSALLAAALSVYALPLTPVIVAAALNVRFFASLSPTLTVPDSVAMMSSPPNFRVLPSAKVNVAPVSLLVSLTFAPLL